MEDTAATMSTSPSEMPAGTWSESGMNQRSRSLWTPSLRMKSTGSMRAGSSPPAWRLDGDRRGMGQAACLALACLARAAILEMRDLSSPDRARARA